MNTSDFEQRKNEILQAVIETYVSEGTPVGSELVSRKLRQSLSPATIRNVMAQLEEAGFLEHPHTSAGRVPTDRGYRYYVDTLMGAIRLTPEETQGLAEAIHAREPEIEPLLARASEVLSERTHQAAFVIVPTVKHSTIRHIELLPVSAHKIVCVLVGEEPFIASHVIDVEQSLTRDEAVALVHFLNAELAGLPARELLAVLERRLLGGSDSFYHLIKRSLAILQTVLATEPEERLFIEGVTHLFEHPEFHDDPDIAQQLMRHLDVEESLLQRLRAELGLRLDEGAHGAGPFESAVRIGHEVGIEGLARCSYILAPFHLRQSVVGGIGILGPRRMDYARLRALVEGMAGQLTGILSQWESDDGSGRI